MKVFVAGASGVIGRRLTPKLVEAGHEVTAMTRSKEHAEALRRMGATPVVCDVYDQSGLTEAITAAAPEAVVHELTDLPSNVDPRKADVQLSGTNRIRTEGTRNLVEAALAAGARRMVAQSIAFAYEAGGTPVKREDDPLFHDAPEPFGRTVEAVRALEDTVTGTEGLEGVVLRYGLFYGPGSAYAADGHYAAEVKRRRFPVIGRGTGVFSFIHVDDAADATVRALEHGRPGIYNVVDDDPAPVSEWLPRYADRLGARKPFRVPKLIGRIAGGPYAVMLMTELRGASNERAKQELGWQPRYPSWREGFREALG
jgi:nucleoside-diphosphate-sugar epimerase